MNASMRLLVLLAGVVSVFALSSSSAFGSTGTLTITGSTTLHEDHYGNVVVAADNATLNCAGHTIHGNGTHGDGTGDGILVAQHTGVTVSHCAVAGFGTGISVIYSTRMTARENVLVGNYEGVYVEGGDHNTFIGNELRLAGGYGGIDVWFSSNATLLANREIAQESVYGSPFGYRLAGSPSGVVMQNRADGYQATAFMAVLGSTNSLFSGNTSTFEGASFYVGGSDHVTFAGNDLSGRVDVFQSGSTQVVANVLRQGWISSTYSTSTAIIGNHVIGSHNDGIYVDGGSGHVVRGNDVRGGEIVGISLTGVDLTELSGNVVTGNATDGIVVGSGSSRVTAFGNTSVANGGCGFFVDATDSVFKQNTALSNPTYGFVATTGAVGNSFVGNTGLRNGIDAVDKNQPGANAWINNRFATTLGL